MNFYRNQVIIFLVCTFFCFSVWANCREFVLFTQPKTGTYLVSPLLTALSKKNQHFAQMEDFPFYPEPARTEEEFEECLHMPGNVPIFMHHVTIEEKDLRELLDRLKFNNEYYACHTPYSEELDKMLGERGDLAFFVLRDPRDYIVSGARFYGTSNQCLFPMEWYQSLPFDEQLMVMMRGTDWYNSVRWVVSAFKGWVYSPNCCVLRFEDLVGREGSVEQIEQLRMMAERLDLDIGDSGLLDAFQEIFGTGPTYSGKIGNWREVFTEEHKRVCKECIGDLLIELGYESDYDW